MQSYRYLIVGGGMTADAAVRGIREVDASGSIGLFSAEADAPYSRPPLSKKLWTGRPLKKIWLGTEAHGVSMHLGRSIVSLDPAAKRVRDDQGNEYGYEKLLLATGGSPNRLPFGGEEIIYLRTVQDYKRLRALSDAHDRFLVIGAGFIGAEIAAALAMQGKNVTMVFPGAAIGDAIYPADVSAFLNGVYRAKGVTLVSNDTVVGLEKVENGLKVHTKGGKTIEVDGVVAGIGIHPNTDLAKSAGLKVENGIVVDQRLRTTAADIFAAGDVAQFPHPALGTMARVEHEDNALKMGQQAGRIMAGANEVYAHTPYFYSDLFEYGFEAVGQLSSKAEIVADWQEKFKTGVVYYLSAGRVRGVLLWNVWGQTEAGAALIAQSGPFKAEDLIGRIKG
ncbi:MAG: FAD-dependent oxidoreductase [Kiritimatiellae bacterium]|nr:FAD-dependent oxidoreductase [Kiritimatiellia bacterium]